MSSINRVFLVGHLGIDPQLRSSGSGDPFCGFTLATSRAWTDKEGAKQERTSWHRIVVWGREAETCAAHLVKGALVGVEGSMEQREYTDKEGQKQRITEVRSQHVTFLGPKKQAGAPRQEAAPASPPARGIASYEEPPMPDYSDLPF